MAMANAQYSVAVLCNCRETLERNLLASDLVSRSDISLQVIEGAASAATAYNRAIESSEAPCVILAHQDVYFPPDWENQFSRTIQRLSETDPGWGVIGAIGIGLDGSLVGEVWSTSQGGRIGQPPEDPVPVQSLDELLLVVRKDSGLRFDEDLPGFHMYGTDIVQQAAALGIGAYASHMPVVHNDRFHSKLGADFKAAYRYVYEKWRKTLPIRTTVLPVTASGLDFSAYRMKARLSRRKRAAISADVKVDPRIYSARCGWE